MAEVPPGMYVVHVSQGLGRSALTGQCTWLPGSRFDSGTGAASGQALQPQRMDVPFGHAALLATLHQERPAHLATPAATAATGPDSGGLNALMGSDHSAGMEGGDGGAPMSAPSPAANREACSGEAEATVAAPVRAALRGAVGTRCGALDTVDGRRATWCVRCATCDMRVGGPRLRIVE
jgi:hypothetical protein